MFPFVGSWELQTDETPDDEDDLKEVFKNL